MAKKKTYVWGWEDEGPYWNGCDTITECLRDATKDVLNQYPPYEFIELMQNHSLCVYVCEDVVNKEEFLSGKLRKYRLAMSGFWYLVKEE